MASRTCRRATRYLPDVPFGETRSVVDAERDRQDRFVAPHVVRSDEQDHAVKREVHTEKPFLAVHRRFGCYARRDVRTQQNVLAETEKQVEDSDHEKNWGK